LTIGEVAVENLSDSGGTNPEYWLKTNLITS